MVKESKAYRYAKWCILPNNNKVGKYVKKQAADWLEIADGNDKDAYVCESTLQKVTKLLKLIMHPDLHCSMYDGMEEYAWFLMCAALCTKNRKDNHRFYVTVILEIARKNFKTFNSAVIFILLMLTEPAFSRFFSVAPDLELSSELQKAIRKIIKSSPLLYAEDGKKRFKLLRKEIRCDITDSEYIPLAYSNDRMDGKLANAFLADEAGALDEYPVEAMRSSQITLFNKLGIIISTQYPNDNNVMIDEIDIAKKTLDGLMDTKRVFSLLYEPDSELLQEEDSWMTDDTILYQANPVAVSHEHIFEELKRKRSLAILYENKRENFLCKHCNIKYKGLGVEGYIEITKVKACKIEENVEFWKGKRVWLGIDLSMTEDNTAVAMITIHDGKLYAKVWCFIPNDRVEAKSKKENVDYKKLIREGVCVACGTEVIDYEEVEAHILSLEETYGVEIVQMGFDRYNAISTINKMESAGYECVIIKQHSSVLHPATKFLKEEVLKKNFAYEDNRLLEINFQNARCTEDTNKNKYVNKKKSEGKVDMVVALINALHLLMQEILYGEQNFVVQC